MPCGKRSVMRWRAASAPGRCGSARPGVESDGCMCDSTTARSTMGSHPTEISRSKCTTIFLPSGLKRPQRKMWWTVDPVFDRQIKDRFHHLLYQAAQGELFSWRKEPKGRLAEIIVLDQFSRNIYRNTPAAFTQDPMALVLAQEAVSVGAHHSLLSDERGFLFLPYMHSESRQIHVQAEALYREHAEPYNYEFELKTKRSLIASGAILIEIEFSVACRAGKKSSS